MPTRHPRTVLLLAAGICAAVPGIAQRLTGDDVILVTPGDVFVFARTDLSSNDAVPGAALVIESPPLHGSLALAGEELSYQPSASFWQRGADAFAYRPSHIGQGGEAATVVLLASRFGSPALQQGFEGTDLDDWLTLGDQGAFELCTTHMVHGLQGLCLDEPSGGWSVGWGSHDGPPTGDGAAQTGGGVTIILHPPTPPPDGGGYYPALPRPFLFLGRQRELALASRNSGGQVEVRGEALRFGSDVTAATAWIPLPGLVHRAELTWLPSGDPASPEIPVVLLVDGVPVGSLTAQPPAAQGIGLWAEPATVRRIAALDDAETWTDSYDGSASSSPFRVLVIDGFEDGSLDAWDLHRGPFVAAEAALAGSRGLAVPLASARGAYVQRDLPLVRDLGLRLSLDLDGAQLGLGAALTLVRAQGSDRGELPLLLSVRRSGSSKELVMTVLDDGVAQDSAPVVLDPGPRAVELGWRAAAGDLPGAARLWIDGALAAEIPELSNHSLDIASVGLGAGLSGMSGSIPTGTIAIDDVVLWTDSSALTPLVSEEELPTASSDAGR